MRDKKLIICVHAFFDFVVENARMRKTMIKKVYPQNTNPFFITIIIIIINEFYYSIEYIIFIFVFVYFIFLRLFVTIT